MSVMRGSFITELREWWRTRPNMGDGALISWFYRRPKLRGTVFEGEIGAWVMGPMTEEEAKRHMRENPNFRDVKFNKIGENNFEVLRDSTAIGTLYRTTGSQWVFSPIRALTVIPKVMRFNRGVE